MPTEQQVKEALENVIDPELGINVVDLGLVYDIDIDEEKGKVGVKMTLTAMGCPLAGTIVDDVKRNVEPLDGVKQADCEIVWSPPWDPSMMSEVAKLQLGFW